MSFLSIFFFFSIMFLIVKSGNLSPWALSHYSCWPQALRKFACSSFATPSIDITRPLPIVGIFKKLAGFMASW